VDGFNVVYQQLIAM